MVKRIIVVKKDDTIAAAAEEGAFSTAEDTLQDDLRPDGWNFDKSFPPVALKGRSTISDMRLGAMELDYRILNKPTKDANVYIVRADVENETSFQNLVQQRPDRVIGVFSDLPIEVDDSASGVYCDRSAVGDSKLVVEKLGVKTLGLTGKNVRVAVIDTGVHEHDHIKVEGGWSPPGADGKPGQWPTDHGTMCAFDLLISAPDARLLDYALLKSREGLMTRLTSDAIAAYANLIDLIQSQPGPLVVSNSWGIYDRSVDYPIGHPGNYSANPNHPFNQIVVSLVAAGADVLFSAGNCGDACPSSKCGVNDIGPGRSIHGAKGLPETIAVAAMTTDNRRLGYSSQGPSGISPRKPDLAAYSHFKGSGVFNSRGEVISDPTGDTIDSGTSAACPVAAGVVVALREKFSNSGLSPDALKAILQRTAIDINKNGWDNDIGYGLINPRGVYDAIQSR